jgi:hypothetical protein
MPRTIKMDVKQWHSLSEKLRADYGTSIIIKSRCREVLGFAPRYHEDWVPVENTGPDKLSHRRVQVHLDFADEEKLTFFTLKYL